MKQSVDAETTGRFVSGCMYRSSEGLKCAIGCLIPDELYDPKYEGVQVKNLPMEILDKIGLNQNDYLFLSRLQLLHDTYQPDEWKERLKDMADLYSLEFKY